MIDDPIYLTNEYITLLNEDVLLNVFGVLFLVISLSAVFSFAFNISRLGDEKE